MNSDIVLMKPAHSVSYFMFDNVWHFIKSIIFRLDVKYILRICSPTVLLFIPISKYVHDKPLL